MCYGQNCRYEKYDRDWNCTCDGTPTDGSCSLIACEVCEFTIHESEGFFVDDSFLCEDCYNNIRASDPPNFYFKAK